MCNEGRKTVLGRAGFVLAVREWEVLVAGRRRWDRLTFGLSHHEFAEDRRVRASDRLGD
jgi:hypothetical protein